MMKLRELRQSHGMTLKQVAALIGVSEASVSMYERGINEPDIKTIRILADYFGVTIDELVGHDIQTDQRQIPDIDVRIALSNGDEPITPAQYAEVVRYAHYLQEKDTVDNQ